MWNSPESQSPMKQENSQGKNRLNVENTKLKPNEINLLQAKNSVSKRNRVDNLKIPKLTKFPLALPTKNQLTFYPNNKKCCS